MAVVNEPLAHLNYCKIMACRKCKDTGTITIKKDNSYCNSCYLVYVNHKFRACIGKNKVIIPNEKILVGISGDIGSTALLDLIYNGITLNSHKKLRIVPEFVYLTGDEEDENEIVKSIIDQCKSYGFNTHIMNISNYSSTYVSSADLPNISRTSCNDHLKKIKQNALASIAKDLQCRFIFTAEPATNLAAKLLSNLVIGRGSQVENDVGFLDNRHVSVKILRPLRDITKEELQHYINIRGLQPVCRDYIQDSLQSVINSFVDTLEKDSPATISTICKTADKIGQSPVDGETDKKCVFCKGKLDQNDKKFTAIQATNFSRLVSLPNQQTASKIEHLISSDEENVFDNSMFPFIHEHLCYCCSRSYAEMENTKLYEIIKRSIINM